jgi:hypothetical protein
VGGGGKEDRVVIGMKRGKGGEKGKRREKGKRKTFHGTVRACYHYRL